MLCFLTFVNLFDFLFLLLYLFVSLSCLQDVVNKDTYIHLPFVSLFRTFDEGNNYALSKAEPIKEAAVVVLTGEEGKEKKSWGEGL